MLRVVLLAGAALAAAGMYIRGKAEADGEAGTEDMPLTGNGGILIDSETSSKVRMENRDDIVYEHAGAFDETFPQPGERIS